jgi:hypothetical protein
MSLDAGHDPLRPATTEVVECDASACLRESCLRRESIQVKTEPGDNVEVAVIGGGQADRSRLFVSRR